ncbi:MAG: NAD(P)-dependent oxidoreductase [Bacteroidota bacterium]
MNITFVGLGIMGSRMAANLLKAKYKLTVFNRSKAPVEKLLEMGAETADSLKLAVADADIVISMLSTPEVVADCFWGAGAALSAMKQNALWVDCSTVNPSFSIACSQQAASHSVGFLDAPVAGTKPHAEKGILSFFVGGESALLEKVRPLLEAMGDKVQHIGAVGKGASFKMLVNIMLAQSMLVFSEALLLGEKMGISKEFLLDVLPNLVVSAPFTKFKAGMIRQGDYEVQFPLEWMQKDLHLAAVTAYELQQPLYLANLSKELYANACKKGMGRLDFAAIHQYLENQ